MMIRNATRNAFVFLLVALVAVLASTHEASSAFYPVPTGTGLRHVTNGKENAAAQPYLETGSGNHPVTGGLRAGDTGVVDVIVGVSSAVDYPFVQYNAAGSTTTFGAGGLYNQQNGYDFRVATTSGGSSMYVGIGGSFIDSKTGLTIQLGDLTQSLNADFTTTLATATSLPITFNATAGELWDLDFWCTCQNTSGGIKFQITAPATGTVEGWLDSVTTTAILLSRQRFTAINTLNTTATNTGVSVPAITRINARLIAVAAGAVSIGVASVTAGQTTTVRAGSGWKARRTTPL